MMKKLFLWILLLAGFGVPFLPALAQTNAAASYPNKPIWMIVPYPPGGTLDVLTRIVSQKLVEKWGQPVVVDNRPGAGGNIGAEMVAIAKGDGYTLLTTPPGPITINQNLYSDMRFDPAKFVSVILMASNPNVITARANFPANSVKELITYVKANPGKITYASQGIGSTSHLTGQMFANMIGVDMIHVPYKGEGPALIDLVGGRVDLFFGGISAVRKLQQTNRVKLLGLASARRTSMAPELPTAAEGGLANFESSAWFAIAAPPGTPDAIASKLNAAVADILKLPDVQQKFALQGVEVVGGTPNEMTEFTNAERTRWKKVIDTAHVKLD